MPGHVRSQISCTVLDFSSCTHPVDSRAELTPRIAKHRSRRPTTEVAVVATATATGSGSVSALTQIKLAIECSSRSFQLDALLHSLIAASRLEFGQLLCSRTSSVCVCMCAL